MYDHIRKYTEALQKLNEKQRDIVYQTEGPVLVVAGPGVGKSQVLTLRGVEILSRHDVKPRNILYLTFTDSAVRTIRNRLQTFLGREAFQFPIHTFHSLGTEIINQNPDLFFFGSDYTPADELRQVQILASILEDLSLNSVFSSFHPEHGWTYLYDILNRISDLKTGGLTPSEFMQVINSNEQILTNIQPVITEMFNVDRINSLKEEDFWNHLNHLKDILINNNFLDHGLTYYQTYTNYFGKLLSELTSHIENKWNTTTIKQWRDTVCTKTKDGWMLKDYLSLPKMKELGLTYELYQKELRKLGLFDFNDMLLEVVIALQSNEQLRYRYQEQFEYVMVDEFQDTSGVQLRLIQLLINNEVLNYRPNILVVGDDDQTIFKFQRASIDNIDIFLSQYKDVKILSLYENYRSRQEILDYASSIIKQCSIRLAHREDVEKNLISRRTFG